VRLRLIQVTIDALVPVEVAHDYAQAEFSFEAYFDCTSIRGRPDHYTTFVGEVVVIPGVTVIVKASASRPGKVRWRLRVAGIVLRSSSSRIDLNFSITVTWLCMVEETGD